MKMPAKDVNIVKIAVEMKDQVPQLIEFNQKQPLAGIIQELCIGWGLTDPEQYALQFNESTNHNYITEKNRNEIKNGSILYLQYSPSKTAQDILNKLNAGTTEEKALAMTKLSKLSADMTFALDFINKQGLTLIIKQIESGKCKGSILAHTLLSFVELMEHGIVSWDILDNSFITRVASFVNTAAEEQVTEAALSILENVVLNSSEGYGQVEKEVPVGSIVTHLQSTAVVQQNALALINALLQKADTVKRRNLSSTLTSKQVRIAIQNHILQPGGLHGVEMAHQLYVLQTLTLGLLEQRMMTKMDPQDQDGHEKIKELRKIAFDNEGPRGPSGFTRDYKKLGFRNDINPALDFTETPPGLLALDCMIYFARNHPDNYTKLVLENSCRADEHECPFGRASVELVRILCDLLKIGEAPSEQGESFEPLFFTHDHPFEECFCICIVLLNKTWKEMKATAEDFGKVASVVREQIVRALQSTPKLSNLDQLRTKLQQLTYSEITTLWQQERNSREEWESHARPIVELREQITPDILSLIKQQRLAFLVEGTRLTKYSQRGQRIKDKFWYIRLSPNHKVLYYGDCDEKSAPPAEELTFKIPVSDIKALLVGKDCPHMKGRKASHQLLAFSLALERVDLQSLDCVAPDETTLAYWTDGINALLGQRMRSKEMEKDLDTLLSMEIKLRLLDAEGVTIPQDPPIIPPDPQHYNFCYDLN